LILAFKQLNDEWHDKLTENDSIHTASHQNHVQQSEADQDHQHQRRRHAVQDCTRQHNSNHEHN